MIEYILTARTAWRLSVFISSLVDLLATLIAIELLSRIVHRICFVKNGFLKVLRLKLAMLIVAVRLFDGERNGIEDVCRLFEYGIHLF